MDRRAVLGTLGLLAAPLTARDLGYTEGHNIVLEYRWAEGRYERFPALIAELLALKVDVIVIAGTPAALAVRRATTAILLVMVAVGDPIGSGLVKSLVRTAETLTRDLSLESSQSLSRSLRGHGRFGCYPGARSPPPSYLSHWPEATLLALPSAAYA